MICASRADTTSTVVSDFETKSAGSWWCFTDKSDSGNSVITTTDSLLIWDSTAFVSGAEGSDGAIKLGFQFGTKNPVCGSGCTYAPQVGLGNNFQADITGATGISFWAKADAPLKVSLGVGTTDITDNGNYSKLVSITTTWKKYTVLFSDLAQPAWAKAFPFAPANMKSIGYSISKGDNSGVSTGALYLDNVVIEGWTYPILSDALVQSKRKAFGAGITSSQSRLHVPLSSSVSAKAGMLAACDAKGHTLGRAAFGKGAGYVELQLENHDAKTSIYLQAIYP